jgi:hypothetical protein
MSRCFVAEPKPDLTKLAEAWAVRTHNYLAAVRPSYAAMFDAATGLSFSYPHVAPENANVIDFIKAKNAVLVNLLQNFVSNDGGISQISNGPNSPNVIGSGNQFNFGTGTSYDFNGAKRTSVGGEMRLEVGEEFGAYQQMVLLENKAKWQELAELGETWIRRNPQWLGSYVFASEAYLREGNPDKARILLDYVSKHAPAEDSHYDRARDVLKQLTP